jgi:hypothetical protein
VAGLSWLRRLGQRCLVAVQHALERVAVVLAAAPAQRVVAIGRAFGCRRGAVPPEVRGGDFALRVLR